MLRAQTLVSENDDRTRETQHVKQAIKMNNYAEWLLTIPHPKSTEDTEEPQNEKKIYASTPYIKGISERLQRAFKSHEVNNNNNIYTGGVLTLSGFRNGPVKNIIKT